MATPLDLVNGAPKGNASALSSEHATNARRKLAMLAFPFEHPTEGLILYERGAGSDYPEAVGSQVDNVFGHVDYGSSIDLDAQIALTGPDLEDLEMVVIGHLHLDHAGGLDHFRNTCIPMYVHELGLEHAVYPVATRTDLGVYLPHYLILDMNWMPFHGSHLEPTSGLTLHHSPGHTPGLYLLRVNRKKESGTWISSSDQNYVKGKPP